MGRSLTESNSSPENMYMMVLSAPQTWITYTVEDCLVCFVWYASRSLTELLYRVRVLPGADLFLLYKFTLREIIIYFISTTLFLNYVLIHFLSILYSFNLCISINNL